MFSGTGATRFKLPIVLCLFLIKFMLLFRDTRDPCVRNADTNRYRVETFVNKLSRNKIDLSLFKLGRQCLLYLKRKLNKHYIIFQ